MLCALKEGFQGYLGIVVVQRLRNDCTHCTCSEDFSELEEDSVVLAGFSKDLVLSTVVLVESEDRWFALCYVFPFLTVIHELPKKSLR